MANGTSVEGARIHRVYAVGLLCLWLFAIGGFLRRLGGLSRLRGARRVLRKRPARLDSWGVIISRVFFHTDIRAHGSGNIGTTNAMRTMGKKGGVAVFVLDFGKGIASGFVALGVLWAFVPAAGLAPAAAFPTYDQMLSVAFLRCVLGHIFSPWLDFKGARGIAVAIGCLFVTYGVVPSLIEIAIFAVLVLATRYVSLGSVAAALSCPFSPSIAFGETRSPSRCARSPV